jgi:hypothetical protein
MMEEKLGSGITHFIMSFVKFIMLNANVMETHTLNKLGLILIHN